MTKTESETENRKAGSELQIDTLASEDSEILPSQIWTAQETVSKAQHEAVVAELEELQRECGRYRKALRVIASDSEDAMPPYRALGAPEKVRRIACDALGLGIKPHHETREGTE